MVNFPSLTTHHCRRSYLPPTVSSLSPLVPLLRERRPVGRKIRRPAVKSLTIPTFRSFRPLAAVAAECDGGGTRIPFRRDNDLLPSRAVSLHSNSTAWLGRRSPAGHYLHSLSRLELPANSGKESNSSRERMKEMLWDLPDTTQKWGGDWKEKNLVASSSHFW